VGAVADGLSWTTYVGAGGIVVHGDRLLMVRQRRPYGVFWEFPSGYYEPGESLEQTTAREVLEETAIEVEIGELVCTMTWQREHDKRRNLLAFFAAVLVDSAAQPRPQTEEDIDEAAFVIPAELGAGQIHPLNQVILDHWWTNRETGFHLHADVAVEPDGTQSYAFR
jgi:ADP-ribose pyrophosphatase YjhB (NUDIX family)